MMTEKINCAMRQFNGNEDIILIFKFLLPSPKEHNLSKFSMSPLLLASSTNFRKSSQSIKHNTIIAITRLIRKNMDGIKFNHPRIKPEKNILD